MYISFLILVCDSDDDCDEENEVCASNGNVQVCVLKDSIED